MSIVVVRFSPHVTNAKRKSWLGAFQCLYLCLLIAVENQRLLGRIQVKCDDIPELFLELGVVGELEGSDQVGLDAIASPDSVDGRGRDIQGSGDFSIGGFVMVGLGNGQDASLNGGGNPVRAPAALGVGKPGKSKAHEAITPFGNSRPAASAKMRRFRKGTSFSAKDDTASFSHSLLRSGSCVDFSQGFSLFVR